MATTTLPELHRTTPKSRPYRLFTVEDVTWVEGHYLARNPATVVIGGWCCSYTTGGHIDGAILSAHHVDGRKHPLHRTTYATRDLAERMAFEAGLTAFMVYEDERKAS